jgi:hypothetical protein
MTPEGLQRSHVVCQGELTTTNAAVTSVMTRASELEVLLASEMQRKSVESAALAQALGKKDATIVKLEKMLSDEQSKHLMEKEASAHAHASLVSQLEQDIRQLRRRTTHNGGSSGVPSVRGSVVMRSPSGSSESRQAVHATEVTELRSRLADVMEASRDIEDQLTTERTKSSSLEVANRQLRKNLETAVEQMRLMGPTTRTARPRSWRKTYRRLPRCRIFWTQ